MSEPLTAAERNIIIGGFASCECPDCRRDRRWEATVRGIEERALAAEARVRALEETLSEALRTGAG